MSPEENRLSEIPELVDEFADNSFSLNTGHYRGDSFATGTGASGSVVKGSRAGATAAADGRDEGDGLDSARNASREGENALEPMSNEKF